MKSLVLDEKVEKTAEEMRSIVLSASLGTLIEWYDFFVFGTLATSISSKFYRTGTSDGNLIAWLGAFAVGFVFRPFGALIFGYMGDKYGRKVTFMTCLLLMGVSTFCVGVIPTYDQIGPAAGILLIILRIIQGMSIGGGKSFQLTF